MRYCRGSTQAQQQAERSVETTIETAEPRRGTGRRYQICSTDKPDESANGEHGSDATSAGSAKPGGADRKVRTQPAGYSEGHGDCVARYGRRHRWRTDHSVGQRRAILERERRSETPGDVKPCDPR